MQLYIDNRSGAPIYDQIYSQIKDAILSGQVAEGEALPSIRALAKDLRISVITTKRAYDELERDGFIYTVQAKGCYVAHKNTELLREENLKKIEGAEGKFVSEKEGIVTNVAVVAGDVTSAGSAVYLADKESGYKFVAELSKDLKKYAKQGQPVVLKIGNSNNEIGDLTIDSISKGEDDNYKVSVLLPTGVGEIGDGGNLTLSSKSKKYQVCVPLEALHQEGQDKYYILVVGEEDTILGTEKVAVRVDVSIADKNDTYAALTEGTISNSQKIIVSSNKTIKEGDRVRLEEE